MMKKLREWVRGEGVVGEGERKQADLVFTLILRHTCIYICIYSVFAGFLHTRKLTTRIPDDRNSNWKQYFHQQRNQ